MRIRLLKIFIPLLIVITVAIYGLMNQFAPSTAFAVGDLMVDWGGGPGVNVPVFNITNWLPGDSETKTVNISNGAASQRSIAIRSEKTDGLGDLEAVVDIIISETGGADLYGGTSSTGPKTVKDFFVESSGPLGLFLFDLAGGANKDIDIFVEFQNSAGNEYQNTFVVFNLFIGITLDIPEECNDIEFDEVLFGTAGNDNINGGAGSQLIIGFEGDDRLRGGAGKDSIVGGDGRDEIEGGAGIDCITGDLGNDEIEGGAGDDVIKAGDGDDEVDGDAGDDIIDGGIGNDKIDGGSGADNILGGEGNDIIDGEAGADVIDGQLGNDTLKGGSGADNLIGGVDTDSANGQTGIDTCSAEVETSCEI
jgi:Ca2+-binding RTX toxin-like protein